MGFKQVARGVVVVLKRFSNCENWRITRVGSVQKRCPLIAGFSFENTRESFNDSGPSTTIHLCFRQCWICANTI